MEIVSYEPEHTAQIVETKNEQCTNNQKKPSHTFYSPFDLLA
jgi:hypothetical protein